MTLKLTPNLLYRLAYAASLLAGAVAVASWTGGCSTTGKPS